MMKNTKNMLSVRITGLTQEMDKIWRELYVVKKMVQLSKQTQLCERGNFVHWGVFPKLGNLWKCILMCLLCVLCMEKVYALGHSDSLRIMSYNVHNAVGMDGKRDYKRIADVISAFHPDIVALQELDSVTHRNKGIYALEQIAQHVDMNYVFGAAINYGGGKYGIGVMSKEKPLDVRRVPLPGREEARVLLIVEYEKYIFLATHLSLVPADQGTSAEMILKEISSMKKPVFMAGDMNSTPSSKPQTILQRGFEILTDCSWVTCNGECIDYIYGYKQTHINFSIIKKVLIEDFVASDHCPVYVDVYYENK